MTPGGPDRVESGMSEPSGSSEIVTNGNVPVGYDDLLREIKARIRAGRVRAALAVNQELVRLYWQIGRDILDRQATQGWGAKV